MTESNRAEVDVRTLVEERQRYLSWLEALEARKDSTASHVYQRVHADYSERLRRVDEHLASRRRTMEEERDELQSRLSELEAEEQARADERAELELRAHVGEVSGPDADEALRTLLETLAKVRQERQELTAKLEALETLVRETPSVATTPVAAAAAETRPQSRSEATAETTPEPKVRSRSHAKSHEKTEAQPVVSASTESPEEAKPAAGSHFDELAFLSSVVGQEPSGTGTRDEVPEAKEAEPQREIFAATDATSGAESLMQSQRVQRPIETPASEQLMTISQSRSNDAEPPLAANVASNNPIVLKSATGSDQAAKTLKCAECGAMNYPTEWYCERCGAELAAL